MLLLHALHEQGDAVPEGARQVLVAYERQTRFRLDRHPTRSSSLKPLLEFARLAHIPRESSNIEHCSSGDCSTIAANRDAMRFIRETVRREAVPLSPHLVRTTT